MVNQPYVGTGNFVVFLFFIFIFIFFVVFFVFFCFCFFEIINGSSSATL